MRLAVFGGSGFIATAVRRCAEDAGFAVQPLHAPRMSVPWGTDPLVAARRWRESNGEVAGALRDKLCDATSVVNAAGLAIPDSGERSGELWGANAVLPALVTLLAVEAGTPHVVHVSSAAVQGRRDPLDEQPVSAPVTPYAEAKAAGEEAVRQAAGTTVHCVIYRPTSVQGPDRGMTRQIVRLCRWPVVPVAGDGSAPLPVVLVENVAAGIVRVAGAAVAGAAVAGAAVAGAAPAPTPTPAPAPAPAIVLQPSEGLTAASLFRLLGAKRLVRVPRFVFRAVIWTLTVGGARRPRLVALARRLELIAFGQQVRASALQQLGFSPPAGHDGYRALRTEGRSR